METLGDFYIIFKTDCWVAVSIYPEGPFQHTFLSVSLPLSKCWDVIQVQGCYCMLLIQPRQFQLIKIVHCYGGRQITCPQKLSILP
jgi:hypothetical protein